MSVLDHINPVVRVSRRAAPVPPEFHFFWSGGVLLVGLVRCSRGAQSSVARLHFLFWSLRARDRAGNVADRIKNKQRLLYYDYTHHPVVDRALEYLRAEELVEVREGKVYATGLGESFLDMAEKSGALAESFACATLLKMSITEKVFVAMQGKI